MGLIFEQASFKSQFLAQWSTYVDAILLYAEQSSKKMIFGMLKDLDRNGIIIDVQQFAYDVKHVYKAP